MLLVRKGTYFFSGHIAPTVDPSSSMWEELSLEEYQRDFRQPFYAQCKCGQKTRGGSIVDFAMRGIAGGHNNGYVSTVYANASFMIHGTRDALLYIFPDDNPLIPRKIDTTKYEISVDCVIPARDDGQSRRALEILKEYKQWMDQFDNGLDNAMLNVAEDH